MFEVLTGLSTMISATLGLGMALKSADGADETDLGADENSGAQLKRSKCDLAQLEAEYGAKQDSAAGVDEAPRIDPQFFTKGQALLDQVDQLSALDSDEPEDLGTALQALAQLQQLFDSLDEWLKLMPQELPEFAEIKSDFQGLQQELVKFRANISSGDQELLS